MERELFCLFALNIEAISAYNFQICNPLLTIVSEFEVSGGLVIIHIIIVLIFLI